MAWENVPSDLDLEVLVFAVMLVLSILNPANLPATPAAVSCAASLLQHLYTAKGTLASCTHWARFLIEWNATLVNHAQSLCVATFFHIESFTSQHF
jgi:hypothetical protein